MQRIKELIVVEGRTDVDRVSLFVSADFYCTNGFYVTSQTVADITALSKEKGVLLFLDNDSAGELIRRKLQAELPFCSHAFITHPWGKAGQVALASQQAILRALRYATKQAHASEKMSWNDFLSLDLTAVQRRRMCRALHVSFCNNKQFFKRLALMGTTKESVERLLSESL